jgi:geranylgeranyl diphosphate synthase type I
MNMDFKGYSKEILPEFEEEIRSTIMNDVPDSYPELREMINYHFGFNNKNDANQSQGKRIRPLIVLLSCMSCGGEWRKALPAAVSIELIHNFSLIHDDIEDVSELRRGRETLWKVYGIAQAINTGDAIFSLAQLNMLKLGNKINKSVGFDALQKLNETCLILTGGQNLDISFENRELVSEDEYFVMIGGKTASLLAASSELGAIITQSSNSNRLALRSFGEALGLAFQAWDDWLGIWGNEQELGKSTSSDLVTKKKTLPILYTMNKSDEFVAIFNRENISLNDVHQLIKLLEKIGAKEYTEKIANYYSELALKSLNSINTSHHEPKKALEELANLLINRIK